LVSFVRKKKNFLEKSLSQSKLFHIIDAIYAQVKAIVDFLSVYAAHRHPTIIAKTYSLFIATYQNTFKSHN